MQRPSAVKLEQKTLSQAITATLAFFALYDLPIPAKRLHELLLNYSASLEEVETELEIMVLDDKLVRSNNLYSLKDVSLQNFGEKQLEIAKKWSKIDKYFSYLAVLPFVRQVSVINSLALGTADFDSDIDFFIITKKNHLYFVRSLVIVLFRMLRVYKTRQKIKDKFCFGFFVSEDNLNLEPLLIKPFDPYFMFWLSNMRPIIGGKQFWKLMQENKWLFDQFPNFKPMSRLVSVKKSGFWLICARFLLEVLLWLPSQALEPLFRWIHVTHTFKLAENNTVTSTTVANAKMLKLHAYDIRAEVAQAYKRVLQSIR